MDNDDELALTFQRTRAGLLAARAGDLAFLAVPARRGGFSVASAHGLPNPPEEWQAAQFWAIHRAVADEDAFRIHVSELAEHRRDVARLDRRETAAGASTPWGVAQLSRVYAPGIVRHATAGHGGFGIHPEQNALVPAPYRNDGGWYEEDIEWAKVAAAFPDLFTSYERACADRTLRDAEPDAYEAVNGIVLEPGASHTKDARRFAREHAQDWIVISAINSRRHPGLVECVATRGGERRPGSEERRFLVDAAIYGVGPFGFVIDEDRDRPFEGPSSFVGGGCSSTA